MFEKFWFEQNFRKFSISVISKNFDFGHNFEKFRFWSKFSKIFDSNQIFEKISILVKIFEKFPFWSKFSKNFGFSQMFEKFWFEQNFRKFSISVISKNFVFGHNFEKFRFGQNFRKSSILIKFSKKFRFWSKFSKNFDFGQIFERFRFW